MANLRDTRKIPVPALRPSPQPAAEPDPKHDVLTGALSDVAIKESCAEALAALAAGEAIAIGYLSFDGFRELNDRVGNLVTDRLLRELGRRLCDAVRECDVVGRISRDEFVIVFRQAGSRLAMLAMISKLRLAMAEPVDNFKPVVNLGLANPPADGTTVDDLIGAAEKAMLVAREQTREAMRRDAATRLANAQAALASAAEAIKAAEQGVRDAEAALSAAKKSHADAKGVLAAVTTQAKALGVPT